MFDGQGKEIIASYPGVWYRMINYIRRAGMGGARADAEEIAAIYPILVRSTYFCRRSRSAAMIEFV